MQSSEVIEQDTVTLGAGEGGLEYPSATHWVWEDVDGDGGLDMIFHFRTRGVSIAYDDTLATLLGDLSDGTQIMGQDSVRTVPPKGKK